MRLTERGLEHYFDLLLAWRQFVLGIVLLVFVVLFKALLARVDADGGGACGSFKFARSVDRVSNSVNEPRGREK